MVRAEVGVTVPPTVAPAGRSDSAATGGWWRPWIGPAAVFAVVVAAAVVGALDGGSLPPGALRRWLTIFVGISVQAIPFLVIGVLLSGLLAAYVTPAALRRVLPARPALAVPVACVAGAAVPGCECASVPVAGRLMGQGVAPGAAVAFLLAAPAINPVVLVSTAVAFAGQPSMVLARFVAGLVTALAVGWIWSAWGRPEWIERAVRRRVPAGTRGLDTVREVAVHDLLHAGGYLVVGAAITALINVAVPRSDLDALVGSGALGVLVMAALAFALSICSEADAFVAASLARSSPTAALAFMVVGPVVDVKLVSMQIGVFGRAFARRFAPLCFGVAVLASVLVGRLVS